MAIGRTNVGNGTSLNFKIIGSEDFPPSTSKNIFPDAYAQSTTYSGITYTVNGDGSITANGTATATSTCDIWGHNDNKTLAAGTYTLSGCPAEGSQNTYMLCSNDNSKKDIGSGTTFTLTADTAISFKIQIASGTTVSNLKFWPQLEHGSTKTSFVKYAQKENTIWINTNVDVSGYTISGISTPAWTMPAGWVYIYAKTGVASGSPEFDIIKNSNEILLTPMAVKQTTDGSQWSDKEAKIYQNGQWADWWDGHTLYSFGNQFEMVTGGWEVKNNRDSTPTSEVTFGVDGITMNSKSNNNAWVTTKNLIDLSNITRIEANIDTYESRGSEAYANIRVYEEGFDWNQTSGSYAAASVVITQTGITALDVTALTGSYYVTFRTISPTGQTKKIKISEVKLV